MKSKSLKYRAYADLAYSQTWKEHLKPDLEKIKREFAMSEEGEDSIESSAIRDIKRSNTLKIINRIIRMIEKADTKCK